MFRPETEQGTGPPGGPSPGFREHLLAHFVHVLSHRSSRAFIEDGGQVEETELAPGGLSTVRPQTPQRPAVALLEAQTLAWALGAAGAHELCLEPGGYPLRDGEGVLRSLPCLLCFV